jgi:hypothetical protein
VVDLDYSALFVDRLEHAIPPGPQAPQIRRPVRERLRRPRLIGESADTFPELSDAGWIIAEEASRQVERPGLPVDPIAHRAGMPRRRREHYMQKRSITPSAGYA